MGNISSESFDGIKKEKSDFYGFDRYDFVFDGRDCIIVMPKEHASGKPWLWRARFFGHEPQTDIALLGRGFAVAYIDVSDMYGSPVAVAHWDKFYELMTCKLGFATKPAMEGYSRGGLIVYNWTAKNPDKVSCIYADAPVCDIKSWPLGLKSGPGSEEDKVKCLAIYGLDEKSAAEFNDTPIGNLEPIAAADIPLLHVCGEVDQTVPMVENTNVLAERYEELGGRIRVVSKAGVDHHPHSLEDPTVIVDFILANTIGLNDHIVARGDLGNSYSVFTDTKKGRVAFLGGSITEMDGYRPKACKTLQKMFPETDFEFINAGIASTCSTTGAFRLERDVLSKGKIDLLFVEFAVNDKGDAAHTPNECIKGIEGIVRHALNANPFTDVVLLYTANESHIASYQESKVPVEIAAHEKVAEHYNLCSVNFASDVAVRMAASEFDWEKFGGVHPADFGAEIYGQSIRTLLNNCYTAAGVAGSEHSMPELMDEYSYYNGLLLDVDNAAIDSGWRVEIPDWKNIEGQSRERFSKINMLCAEQPEDWFELDFDSTAIGLFVVAGPDAGIVEYSIDDSETKTADLYHHFSESLHYPRTVMLEKELATGNHKLKLKLSSDKNPKSKGTSARIIAFAIN
ncbi:MAG: GDSL-type esterase/lipase family protein [Sedimentisphaeraceae bacterium JB056]